jgi:flagellar assembly factor FliW
LIIMNSLELSKVLWIKIEKESLLKLSKNLINPKLFKNNYIFQIKKANIKYFELKMEVVKLTLMILKVFTMQKSIQMFYLVKKQKNRFY